MKISRDSDNSITFIFNNIEVVICYPLIRFSLIDIAIKLNTEISYYKFNTNDYSYPNNPLLDFGKDTIEYVFTFIVLGLGVIVIYTIKENE